MNYVMQSLPILPNQQSDITIPRSHQSMLTMDNSPGKKILKSNNCKKDKYCSTRKYYKINVLFCSQFFQGQKPGRLARAQLQTPLLICSRAFRPETEPKKAYSFILWTSSRKNRKCKNLLFLLAKTWFRA